MIRWGKSQNNLRPERLKVEGIYSTKSNSLELLLDLPDDLRRFPFETVANRDKSPENSEIVEFSKSEPLNRKFREESQTER